jgi:hypothetical protein
MTAILEKKFADMGARVKVSAPRRDVPITIDIRKDEEGEFFDIRVKDEIDMLVLDVQKKDRHLLLMTKEPILDKTGQLKSETKSKFLCGHDERHWFTCAIPESAKASTVIQAKQALKPKELIEIETKEKVNSKNAHKRHRLLKSGKKIHRQGEFMFIPDPDFILPKGLTKIWENEPMQGGGSHSHFAQFLFRSGGTTVWILRGKNFNKTQYEDHLKEHPHDRRLARQMVRDPIVHVKGKITHEEHATVNLGDVWHKVLMNTEAQAKAKKNVIFID